MSIASVFHSLADYIDNMDLTVLVCIVFILVGLIMTIPSRRD